MDLVCVRVRVCVCEWLIERYIKVFSGTSTSPYMDPFLFFLALLRYNRHCFVV